MKTTLIDVPPKPSLKFPCLMLYKLTEHVVLFSGMETGTVVHQANGDWKPGTYTGCWTRADDTSWEPFIGRIQLSN